MLWCESNFASYSRQEPWPPPGLVDPTLDQAGRGDVALSFADFVSQAQEPCKLPVIGAKLTQHRQRGRSNLPRALRDIVRHDEDSIGLILEQQAIAVKMRPAVLPVKVLRLQV